MDIAGESDNVSLRQVGVYGLVVVVAMVALQMVPGYHETEAAAHVIGNRTISMEDIPFRGPGQVFVEYCSSDEYRSAYQRIVGLLQSRKSCKLEVHGAEFSIPPQQRLKARAVFAVQLVSYAIILGGDMCFQALGLSVPNKLASFMFVWMAGNMLSSKLVSTGAFEIFFEGKLLWSSLRQSSLPDMGDIALAFSAAGVDIVNGCEMASGPQAAA